MRDYSKNIKRLLREYAPLAHEEELRRALVPLSEAFDGWKAGKVSSGEISHLIHEFHQGPARELFNRYTDRVPDIAVASAIARGILDKRQIPTELLEALSRLIENFESDAA